jgi:hypothetical protein
MSNRALGPQQNGHGRPLPDVPVAVPFVSPSMPPGDPTLLRQALAELGAALRLIEHALAADRRPPTLGYPECWADDDFVYIEAEWPEMAGKSCLDVNLARGRVLIRSSRETGRD